MDLLRIAYILILSLFISSPVFAGTLAGEEDGTPNHNANFCYALKFADGNITTNADGSCSIADQGAAGGDSVSIDSVAVVDPDFVSTGDIDFVDTTNTVTANINAGVIDEAKLDVTNSPTDNFVLSYNAAGTNFTWAADAGGAETNDLESVATSAGDAEIFVGTGADAGAYITGLAPCAADEKIEYVPGAPDTFTCEAIGSLVDADIGDIALGTGTSGNYAAGDAEAGAATNIQDGLIIEPDLDGDVAPVDGDFLQYDSTGTNFTWRSAVETTSDLSLVIGTNTQAWDAELDTIAALTETNGNVMFVAGGAWTSDATPAIEGSDITALNATQLTSGSVPAARVAADHIDAITEIAAAIRDSSGECAAGSICTGGHTHAGGADTNSVKEYWWPASATLPAEAGNKVAPIVKDEGTNLDQLTVDFDDSTDECRTVSFKVPSDVDTSANATFRLLWYSGSATTNETVWYIGHNDGTANDVDPDTIASTETSAADTAPGTAGMISHLTWTASISTMNWAANDYVLAEVCRDADNVSDDFSGDAKMVGFGVEIPRA